MEYVISWRDGWRNFVQAKMPVSTGNISFVFSRLFRQAPFSFSRGFLLRNFRPFASFLPHQTVLFFPFNCLFENAQFLLSNFFFPHFPTFPFPPSYFPTFPFSTSPFPTFLFSNIPIFLPSYFPTFPFSRLFIIIFSLANFPDFQWNYIRCEVYLFWENIAHIRKLTVTLITMRYRAAKV